MSNEVSCRIAAADARTATLQALLEASRDAVVVCDRHRRPLFANKAAERLLAEGDGLGIGVGGLVAATSDDTRKLRAAIEQAARLGTMRLRLPRRGGGCRN